MEYVLRTTNLTKMFYGKTAVNSANIEIKKGEIYGLIGKNGAGKTTIIRMIDGLASPTDGEIELFGSYDVDNGRRKIGTMIENPALVPHFTAYQNMELQSIIVGEKDKSEIDRILRDVGLDNTGKKKAKNFSLGMKQRLAIGLSLLGKPEFLLLDEPINGLDPIGIKEVRNLIIKLNKEYGITILISSHILSELYKIATSYGIISNGSLIKQLTSEELNDHLKEYIRIETTNEESVSKFLKDEFDVREIEIGDGYVYVYDHDINDIAKINNRLACCNLNVSAISKETPDPESYFINLMEGKLDG